MKFNFYLPKYSRLLLVWSIILLTCSGVKAEGSKDFWGYPGYRLFYNAEQNQQLKVFARAGEFINVGASHVGLTGGFIQVFDSNGVLVATFDGADGTAIIHNHIEELNGPTGGGSSDSTGYIPGVVPVAMGAEGIWTIQLSFPNPTREIFTNIMNGTPWDRATDQPTIQRAILAWDVTVTQGAAGNELGAPVEGRVYSNEYISIQNGNEITTSPTFYILSKDGYIYQIDFNETDPWGFPLFSNSFGIVKGPQQQPSYLSFPDSIYTRSADPSSWNTEDFYLYDPQAKDQGSLINNKIFFNPPDINMPSKAMVTDIANMDTHTTWLFNLLGTAEPQLTDIGFQGFVEDAAICDPSISTVVGNGGYILFTSNNNGTASVKLDIDNNGSFNDIVDRCLSTFVSTGRDSVLWDGRDGVGNIVPATPDFQLFYNIESRSGEIHIMMLDVENNPGGVTFTRMNGLNSPSDDFYYDHSLVGGGVSGDGVPGEPQVTNIPFTYSGSFGNNLLLDYWTFIEFPNPASGTFSIAIYDDCTSQSRIDADGDGTADFLDIDDDNDGITDIAEYCNSNPSAICILNGLDPSGDEDGDLILNYLDAADIGFENNCLDSDADGICDQLSSLFDLDGDNVPDHLDLDSDNDGITDLIEAGHLQADADNNGRIDGDAALFGANGFFNAIATDPDAADAEHNYFISDKDKDRVPDYKDLDTDNDGIHDVTEGNFGVLDTNNDGRIDNGSGESPIVTGNGLALAIIPDVTNISIAPPPDTDGDGVFDWQDLDSDNDGIFDVVENLGLDPDGNGLVGIDLPAVNSNGSALDTTTLLSIVSSIFVDTDGDQLADFRDLDSDADGIFDVREAGQPDPDNNGVVGMGIPVIDRNGQSIEDATGTTITILSTLPDTDGDLQSDFQDVDRDNDGIPDSNECPGGWPCADTDGDLILDLDDPDSDNDLLLDIEECPGGIPCLDDDNNEIANFLQYNCHSLNTPVLNTMTRAESFCKDAPVLLIVSRLDSLTDSLTYTWTGPNDFLLTGQAATIDSFTLTNLDTSGLYNLVVSTPQGCASEVLTTNISILDTIATPIVRLSSTRTCVGEDIELTTTAFQTDSMRYDWYFDNGDTTVLLATTMDSIFALTDVQTTSSGNYSVLVEGAACAGSLTSESISLSVESTMDSLVLNLSGDRLCEGENLLLTTNAFPLDSMRYDWYFDNGDSTILIASTIDSMLAIDSLQAADMGVYSVAIDGLGCGSMTSEPLALIVDTPVDSIAINLNETGFCAGEDAVLTTTAFQVDSMAYDWYFDNGDTTILVATTFDSLLELTNLQAANAGIYTVAPSGTSCNTNTSEPIQLSIDSAMEDSLELFAFAFTEDPICSGTTITLSVFEVDTDSATYEWYGPQGLVATGSTIEVDTTSTGISGLYHAVVQIGNCTVESNEIEVDIKRSPERTPEIDLSKVSFCAGEELTLSTALVAGDSVNYQWYFDDGENMELIATTSDTMLVLDSLTEGQSGTYAIMVDIEGCTSNMSELTTLEIFPSLEGIEIATTFDTASLVCEGTPASLQLTEVDSTASLTWFGPNDFTTTESIINFEAINDSLSGTYFANIVQGNCTSTTSEVAIQVGKNPSLPEVVAAKIGLCTGEDIELSVAEMTTDSLTYLWMYQSPDTSELATLLATTATANFVINNTTSENTGTYSVVTVLETCASEAATAVAISVQEPLEIPQISSSLEANATCEGTDIGLLVEEVAGYTYEWFGPNGSFSTQASPSLGFANLETAGIYYVEASEGNCTTTSDELELTIHPIPQTPTVLVEQEEFCFGNTISLAVEASALSGVQYEWYRLRNTDLQLLANTQDPNFDLRNVSQNTTGNYAVIATANGCSSEPSSAQFISVNPSLVANATSSAIAATPACAGETITFSVPEIRGISYEWYGPNGLFSRQRTPEIVAAMPAVSGRYFAVLNSGTCSESTEPIDVLVNAIPAVPALSVTQNDFCSGETIQLNATITNGNSLVYNWYFNNGADTDLVASTEEPTYFIEAADVPNNGQYSVEVIADGCASSVSNIQQISVGEALGVLKASSNATLSNPACEGERIILTATDVADAEYEWHGPDGIVSRTKGFTLPNSTAEDAGKYYARITTGGCTKLTNEVDVVINRQPEVPLLLTQNNALCFGDRLELATAAYSGLSVRYNWFFDNGDGEDLLITTTPTPNFSLSDATEGVVGAYAVQVVVDGCTSPKSNAQFIDIQSSLEGINAFSTVVTNRPICEGEAFSFFTTPAEGATYQWFGPNGFFSDQPEPSISNSSMDQAGAYYAVIDFDGCATVTNEVDIQVNPKPDKPELFVESSLCTGDVLQLSATSFEAQNISYAWIFNDGKTESVLASTSIPTFPISNLATNNSGFYSVSVNVNGCTSSASNLEQVEVQAPLADMSVSSTATLINPACTGDRIDLGAPFVEGATYEWFGPNNFTSTLVKPAISDASMEDNGDYFAVVTLNGCPTTTSTVQVAVKAKPETPFVSAREMQVCEGESAYLEATNSIGTDASRDLFYQWFQESSNNLVGETQEGLLKIPNMMEEDEGNYFVALMNEGCVSEASNMVNVEVDAIPEETAFILDNSGSFCAESEVIVEAVQPTIGTGQWSVTNSTATIVDAVNNSTVITDLDKGGNTILWSLSFKGCENYSTDTISYFRDASFVQAENDEYTIDINQSLDAINLAANDQLDGVSNYSIQLLVRPAFGQIDKDDTGMIKYTPNPNFYGYDEFEYEVCNTSCSDMCDRAFVRINIVDEERELQCFVPNVITPNGDGLNDGLRIPCVDQIDVNSEIKIFNRWGDQVYESAIYKNDWNGTFDGKPLPPGTYFYLLRLGNDQTKCQQGYFQLLR